MPWVGLEPTIAAFERAKKVHALDPAATVIGIKNSLQNRSLKQTFNINLNRTINLSWVPCARRLNRNSVVTMPDTYRHMLHNSANHFWNKTAWEQCHRRTDTCYIILQNQFWNKTAWQQCHRRPDTCYIILQTSSETKQLREILGGYEEFYLLGYASVLKV
jgi:hypothetical protein